MDRTALAALALAALTTAGCATSSKPATTAAAPPAPPAAIAPAPAPAAPALTPAEAAEARALALALERIHFPLDSAALGPAARAALDEAAGHLRKLPDMHLHVEGHADARGSAEWNRDLAEWRAQAVIEALAARGIERARLELIAHGEAAPLALGETELAHAMNRRVEFSVMKGEVQLSVRQGQLVDDAGRPIETADARW